MLNIARNTLRPPARLRFWQRPWMSSCETSINRKSDRREPLRVADPMRFCGSGYAQCHLMPVTRQACAKTPDIEAAASGDLHGITIFVIGNILHTTSCLGLEL